MTPNDKAKGNSERNPAPYSFSITGASVHFGIAKHTFYNWINEGRLHRGHHYLKVGRKVLIVREAFIEFLQDEDGGGWKPGVEKSLDSAKRDQRYQGPGWKKR